MPCNNGRPDYQDEVDARIAAACLCGILRTLAAKRIVVEVLNDTDWSRAGVSRERFQVWWRRHADRDARIEAGTAD